MADKSPRLFLENLSPKPNAHDPLKFGDSSCLLCCLHLFSSNLQLTILIWFPGTLPFLLELCSKKKFTIRTKSSTSDCHLLLRVLSACLLLCLLLGSVAYRQAQEQLRRATGPLVAFCSCHACCKSWLRMHAGCQSAQLVHHVSALAVQSGIF